MIAEALALALDHHLAGRLAEAQTLYNHILDADPDQPDALHYLGVLAGQLGEHTVGLRLLDRALMLRPDAADMHASRAYIRRALAHTPAEAAPAIADYRRAIALRPDFSEAWTDMAAPLRMSGDTNGAIAALERALAANPDLAAAAERLSPLLRERGRLSVESGNILAALPPLGRALALSPLDADIAFYYGNALYAAGLREDALGAYRRALAILPDFPTAAFNLGIALGSVGRVAESALALEQAARLDPRHTDAMDALTVALGVLGLAEVGAAWAEHALTLKDRTAVEQAPALPPLPAAPRGVADRRRRDLVVIGLWGDRPADLDGALATARRLPTLLPGWGCRVHHDGSPPPATLAALAEAGAELVGMAPGSGPPRGAYWPLSASDAPDIAHFLTRDAADPLMGDDAAAVAAWVASGRPFLVLRRDRLDTELIRPGRWGGHAGLLPDTTALIERYAGHETGAAATGRFLRRIVWPLVRGRVSVVCGTGAPGG